LLKNSLYWLEQRIYSKAKGVVALSEPIGESIRRKTSGTPVVVIPNMADTRFYQMEPKDPQLENRFGTTGSFVVSYVGAVGFANGLDHFLECARACKQQNLPVKFILCGEGALTNHFHNAKKRLVLDNLDIVPFQDREGVRAIMNVSDATFISYRPDPILETGSPHKYFDGLACGNLIVVNFGGWIKDEILREQCGFAVESRNPAGFATQLRRFLDNPDELQRYRTNARRLAETKYSRELLTKRFVDLFR
ncbi:MAG TPA: glycosyltransferase family 4 protein, partial [Ohtaekwangia sp.]|nr:glycosyltransferase family 4 protein [Ohtaekwangia sp.]